MLDIGSRMGIYNLVLEDIVGYGNPRATFNWHTGLNQTGLDEIEVQFNSPDNIARNIPLHSIEFIKIDVENHEIEVLKGAIGTIARFMPPKLIEIESRHHKFPVT
jgi:FkbM family methyltransferase